jgi:hypothetical protein
VEGARCATSATKAQQKRNGNGASVTGAQQPSIQVPSSYKINKLENNKKEEIDKGKTSSFLPSKEEEDNTSMRPLECAKEIVDNHQTAIGRANGAKGAIEIVADILKSGKYPKGKLLLCSKRYADHIENKRDGKKFSIGAATFFGGKSKADGTQIPPTFLEYTNDEQDILDAERVRREQLWKEEKIIKANSPPGRLCLSWRRDIVHRDKPVRERRSRVMAEMEENEFARGQWFQNRGIDRKQYEEVEQWNDNNFKAMFEKWKIENKNPSDHSSARERFEHEAALWLAQFVAGGHCNAVRSAIPEPSPFDPPNADQSTMAGFSPAPVLAFHDSAQPVKT